MAKQLPKTTAEKAFDKALKDNPGLESALRSLVGSVDVEDCNNAAIALLQARGMDGYAIQASLMDPVARRRQFSPGHIATMARWNHCKHVFRFDSELAQALLDQEAPSVIPSEALTHLPYLILYIEAPVQTATVKLELAEGDSKEIIAAEAVTRSAKGFFAYVTHFSEKAVGHEFDALNIMYVFDDLSLSLTQLDLSQETLGDVIQGHLEFIERDVAQLPAATVVAIKETLSGCFAQVVNLLLYIVAENAETEIIYKPSGLSKKPQVAQAEIIAVGTRIGADLKAARVIYVGEKAEPGHATKAAHIRRGHYHSFWTGPKSEAQILKIKWLSPIAVNAGKTGDGVVTVHGVKE